MTKDKLSLFLKEMYESGIDSRSQVAMIHLFGIRYSKDLQVDSLSIHEIVKNAGISSNYSVEISKGINLANYVEEVDKSAQSEETELEETLSKEELSSKLKNMYNSASEGEAVTMIHLFGIRYAKHIKKVKISAASIVMAAGLHDSYATEVSKGIKLSGFVKEKIFYSIRKSTWKEAITAALEIIGEGRDFDIVQTILDYDFYDLSNSKTPENTVRKELQTMASRDLYSQGTDYPTVEPAGGKGSGIWKLLINQTGTLENANSNYKKREKIAKKLPNTELQKRALSAEQKTPPTQKVTTTVYYRDANIAEYAFRRANGICQLCKSKAPFDKKSGEPYLESHHICWLSKGGEDTIQNTVALCANCHRKMHVLDLEDDKLKLLEIAKEVM
ncbi:MAG: HNH endonuclease [Defluviitaleaceae bacterium]|nr:HNH endonuclease [Defluviitaleaceae bacterium]